MPLRFLDFDIFTKLSVLQQLSVWTFWNPDRIREKMPEKKDSEQLEWVSLWSASRMSTFELAVNVDLTLAH